MRHSTQPASTDQHAKLTGLPCGALAGLSPMGLMDAVLSEDSQDWQPPAAEELEAQMEGYEAFAYLDRGGMGAVYAATQKSLSRRVAIKVLPAELGADENFIRLFEREGQMLGQLQHSHIVMVYGSGRTTTGHLYIVMEYVEGVTLLEHFRDHRPTVTKALEITAQVCEALEYAHRRGVVHLDIKPGNILIDERGLVRVADFGLARDLRKFSGLSPTSKRTSGFIGTVGYAAPEQLRAEGVVDHRADIFSLGITLYEMLTGHLPSGVFDPPSRKMGAPAHVDKIVLRAMRETPQDRYQSAEEMRSAIATSMLRLGTPLVQRAIISRPIVSMVTCVIVGMSFIYLLDGLSQQLSRKPSLLAAAQPAESSNVAKLPVLTILDDNWAVVPQSLNWDDLMHLLGQFPSWQFAEIHSAEEQQQVAQLLRRHQLTRPLWLGATFDEDAPGKGFQWLSGTPMAYHAWMPTGSPTPLVITEIQARNNRTFKTTDGETPDWIEIHNPNTVPVDLTGYHLRHYFGGYLAQDWISRDSAPETISMIMQPGEYRVICCNPRLTNAAGYTRLEFSLEGRTGRLEWSGPQGWVWQKFEHNWANTPEDASIGVAANGKEWGWCQQPTPGQPNSALTRPFPAPVEASPERARVILLPEFGAQWARSPAGAPHHALLRRAKK